MKLDNNSLIHLGHRQRMKDKLSNHGARIFDTYELLEMLLYNVIPYKDTNPIAKRLLIRFGSLRGVLSASSEELCEVEGVGKKAAELISLVGRYERVLPALTENSTVFDNYHAAGRFFVEYFNENKDEKVVMLLLDNSMRLLGIKSIPCTHFGSAAVRPSAFLDAVAKAGAGNVLVACNHRYGALYMSESEIASYRSIKISLSAIRVSLGASYVVSGNNYTRINTDFSTSFACESAEYIRFINSISEGVFSHDV